MLTLADRANLVLAEAWRLLPPIKREALISEIRLEDLGAVHGTYHPDSGVLELNARLFEGDMHMIPLIDIRGESPPKTYPIVSRALHTSIHEAAHAIGYATGLDQHAEWLALSGWVHAEDDPVGTARYHERRPGWEQETSEWRYRLQGSWFTRDYAGKTPFEDFADTVTHTALGWTEGLQHPGGQAKVRWLRRMLWNETGPRQVQASRERWRMQIERVRAAAISGRDHDNKNGYGA